HSLYLLSLHDALPILATIDDAEATRAIYNVEVTESTVTFDLVPRTLEEQRAWLTARSGAHAVLVAEDAGEVIGFASVSPYRDRPDRKSTRLNSSHSQI